MKEALFVFRFSRKTRKNNSKIWSLVQSVNRFSQISSNRNDYFFYVFSYVINATVWKLENKEFLPVESFELQIKLEIAAVTAIL